MCWIGTVSLLLLGLLFISVEAADGPIVNVPGVGRIQGISGFKSQVLKRNYFAFKGIEYGEPPIEGKRFQPSVLRRPYDVPVFHADKYGPACPQTWLPFSVGGAREQYSLRPNVMKTLNHSDSFVPMTGEENCLMLNIYTPKLPTEENPDPKLPVIVFIHGGGFYSGFLCLHTPEIPGNAGLYDQVLALQWVQKHISAFGGDPTRITINGQSAGSASVSYHIISPLSKGLFHGAIAESGSALSPWALTSDPVGDTLTLAWFAGCKSNNITVVGQCLLKMSAEDITKAFTGLMTYNGKTRGDVSFEGSTPCVQEIRPEGFEKFISKPPIDILKSGDFNHVPAIFGNNRDEGSFVAAEIFLSYLLPRRLEQDPNFMRYYFLQELMNQMHLSEPSGFTMDALLKVYFQGLNLADFRSMSPGLVDILGASTLKSSTYEALKYTSAYNTSFFYSFEYPGEHTTVPLRFLEFLIPMGVAHSDEIIYTYTPDFFFPLNATERLLSRKMIKMWTNFAKFQNPTPNVTSNDVELPNWKPFTEENPYFLRFFSPNKISMDENFPKLWTYEKDHALKQMYKRKYQKLDKKNIIDIS